MTTRKLTEPERDRLHELAEAIREEIASMGAALWDTAWHTDRVAELKRLAAMIYG